MKTQHIPSFDGQPIAVHETGEGAPVLLLHGLFSSAEINWIRFGTAERIAAAGHRVILPDLRGHGDSASPTAARFWPKEVLARDTESVIRALGLADEDLVVGGYSLGARTVVQLLQRGFLPKGAILAGMGLEGLRRASGMRADMFANVIENHLAGTLPPRGTPEFAAQTFLARNVPHPAGLRNLIPLLLENIPANLAAITCPVLVLAGESDHDNGSAEKLAAALPSATYAAIPGNHMTAVSAPELAGRIIAFLASV